MTPAERAHKVLREWLLNTPALDAQIRTFGAQLTLEKLIADAIEAAVAEAEAK